MITFTQLVSINGQANNPFQNIFKFMNSFAGPAATQENLLPPKPPNVTRIGTPESKRPFESRKYRYMLARF